MVDHERSTINLRVSSAFRYKAIPFLSLSALTIFAVGFILVSPVALGWIGTFKGLDWNKLSSIGQTYGAVSAVIAGIALAGVAVSLILQWRSLGLSRMEIMRNYHHDLIKFTIEHPELLPSWGYLPSAGSDLEDEQRVGFVSMLIGFWRTSYEGKMIHDEELRENITHMFKGEAGRKGWADSREAYAKSINSRRASRFFQIIEEQFSKAENAGPPVSLPPWLRSRIDKQDIPKKQVLTRGGSLGLSFGAGVLAAQVFRYMIKHSSNRQSSRIPSFRPLK